MYQLLQKWEEALELAKAAVGIFRYMNDISYATVALLSSKNACQTLEAPVF